MSSEYNVEWLISLRVRAAPEQIVNQHPFPANAWQMNGAGHGELQFEESRLVHHRILPSVPHFCLSDVSREHLKTGLVFLLRDHGAHDQQLTVPAWEASFVQLQVPAVQRVPAVPYFLCPSP